MRRVVSLPLLLMIAGCGSGSDTSRILGWDVEPPYLPPRPPAAKDGAPATTTKQARPPASGGAGDSGAPSDAEVRRELEQAFKRAGGSSTDLVDAASVDGRGLATVPPAAPARVAQIINAGNQVARKPYVYGGGHGRAADEIWIDTAYDCSGSISFALAAAGYLDGPLDSSRLARFGKPGPGKWVSIYANAGHAFMIVAGLRFDTSGRRQTGSRWQTSSRGVAGFTVRHPPGL